MSSKDAAGAYLDHFRRDVRSLVQTLRNAANRIEELGDAEPTKNLKDLHPEVGITAAGIIHEMAALIGNAHLDMIALHAGHHDIEIRKGS